MTEIRFYHIQKKSAEQTVFDLADIAVTRGHRVLVRLRDAADAARLNDFLWTAKPESFLPHGVSDDAQYADFQPVLLTATNENANNADLLFLMPGADTSGVENFARVFDILDGHSEEQIAAGRMRYRDWKAQGHAISYWQQNEAGKWEQKS
jgi:DNA polymerase-3 subunit chi